MVNRNAAGIPFTEEVIQKIWEKALPIPGEDPSRVRRDICGAIIRRENFNHSTKELSFGWEIDHIKPISKGGTDDYYNLQPLHWENNRGKGEEHPSWSCKVSGDDITNQYLKK